jgi:hypothetical protein
MSLLQQLEERRRVRKEIHPSPFLLLCLPPHDLVSHFACPFPWPLSYGSLFTSSFSSMSCCCSFSIYITLSFLPPVSLPRQTLKNKPFTLSPSFPYLNVPTARTHAQRKDDDDDFLGPSPSLSSEAAVGVLPLSHLLLLVPSFVVFSLASSAPSGTKSCSTTSSCSSPSSSLLIINCRSFISWNYYTT